MIVDDKYLFKQHISSICHKAYSTINVIFRCFHTANIDAFMPSMYGFHTVKQCSSTRQTNALMKASMLAV